MTSILSDITVAEPDAIFGVQSEYHACDNPKKVNLGIGAYKDNDGKSWILPVVKKTKTIFENNQSYMFDYLPSKGSSEFCNVAAKLLFGEVWEKQKEQIAVVQSLGGTGALRVGAEFIKRHIHSVPYVYVSRPTWSNHHQIFNATGHEVREYRYYDSETVSFSIDKMIEDLNDAPEHSIIVLHACAHNPTGFDPTKSEWETILETITNRRLIPFFDCAYQGFASGDIHKDAWSIRYFAKHCKIDFFVAQSFSKNFGLYNSRCGTLSVVLQNEASKEAIISRLQKVARPMYSNPPYDGAQLVHKILTNSELSEDWQNDITTMSQRLISMRYALYNKLQERETPGDWGHLIKQIGMFSYLGISKKQVDVLKDRFAIYLLSSGRISLAGLNDKNIDYVADAIDFVVRN